MIDGCPDRWVGAIPVCVLSATSQQDHSSAARAPSREGTVMKERDYISHGLAAAQEQVISSAPSSEEKMDCDKVELSLGLGLRDKANPQSEVSIVELSHGAQLSDMQLKSKTGPTVGNSQHFWHQEFRGSLNCEQNHYTTNWQGDGSTRGVSSSGKRYASGVPAWSSVVTPRLAVPAPKVSTTPAKRPYQDTNPDRNSSSGQGELVPRTLLPTPAGVYGWNSDPYGASQSAGGGRQQVHVKFEQAVSGNAVRTLCGHGTRQLPGAMPAATSTKVPHVAASKTSMPPPSSASVAASGALPLSHVAENHEADHDSIRNKAPVVGWPPVRSFRKNTLQAAHTSNRMSCEDLPTTKCMGGLASPSDALDLINGNNNKNAFFVKAKLDGVRICRKVDLKAYSSYEGLKSALQEMFQGFLSENAKLDLVNGTNYVVTHEDKDGDYLLVGDVPWHMFLESVVKSLRIMKAMDAIGIGEKGSVKLRPQEGNGKLA